MKEILPGVCHWTGHHPQVAIQASSYYLLEAGTLIDPMLPVEGLAWFLGRPTPRDILLTNRQHYRHSRQFVEAFDCTVWCNERGMYWFQGIEHVRGFRAGDLLTGGVESHEIGILSPDETALRLPVEAGALAVGDALVRDGNGPIQFLPDALLGDDPGAVKRALEAAYGRLLALDFEHVFFAHGLPWLGGAKEALRSFVQG